MTITVHISSMLREYSHSQAKLSVAATTVKSTLEQLAVSHPGLYQSVCDETGEVRRHVNLFVNSSLIRDPAAFETRLEPGDVLTIMPAVSGG